MLAQVASLFRKERQGERKGKSQVSMGGEAVLVALQISSLFEPLMPSVHLTCSVGIFKPTKKKIKFH